MSKLTFGEGENSVTISTNNSHSNSEKGDTVQNDKYTYSNEDKGEKDMPKVHEYSGRNYSTGKTFEGGRGENFGKPEGKGSK